VCWRIVAYTARTATCDTSISHAMGYLPLLKFNIA
jgi:hypothetical protein